MANDFITLDRTKRVTAQLGRSIDTLAEVVADLRHLKARFDHMAAHPDYTRLGTELGLSAENAEAVYNLTGSALTTIDVSLVQQFVQRIG